MQSDQTGRAAAFLRPSIKPSILGERMPRQIVSHAHVEEEALLAFQAKLPERELEGRTRP